MKISYTTLACPEWDLKRICAQAVSAGYDGIDFRGYLDQIDISQHALFQRDQAGKMIQEFGLEVSGVSSSIKICDTPNQAAALEEARRTIEVCQRLQAKHVRVFGGGDSENLSRETLANAGRDTMEKILQIDGAQGISWDFETHDVWIGAKDCKLLLELIPFPQFNILWDMGNSFMFSQESTEIIWEQIGERMVYSHIKDAVYRPDEAGTHYNGWRYVMPGTGELPLAEAVRVLNANGYQGWFVLEHEKRWHSDLAAPEEVLPVYAKWMRSLLEKTD